MEPSSRSPDGVSGADDELLEQPSRWDELYPLQPFLRANLGGLLWQGLGLRDARRHLTALPSVAERLDRLSRLCLVVSEGEDLGPERRRAYARLASILVALADRGILERDAEPPLLQLEDGFLLAKMDGRSRDLFRLPIGAVIERLTAFARQHDPEGVDAAELEPMIRAPDEPKPER